MPAVGLVGEQRGESRLGVGIQRLLHRGRKIRTRPSRSGGSSASELRLCGANFSSASRSELEHAVGKCRGVAGKARIAEQLRQRPQSSADEAQLARIDQGRSSSLAPSGRGKRRHYTGALQVLLVAHVGHAALVLFGVARVGQAEGILAAW